MNKNKLLKLAKSLSLEGSEEVVPKGFYRREELCKMMGYGTNYVCQFLKNIKLNEPERIEHKRFKIRNSSGGISSIIHYKIKL
ncbi:hypothetical protein UFOVP157_52 [uncultured Caudovirales phage]|uniref:Uncharacterized protein n=1 Tax=uncultured Caudovirales phage TaxID=2100421 RepID=A0A6J7W970_9CAUD|nr:hypothetical protein UFOVP157_52 [uncultured Caudovirales phage]